MKLGGGAAYVAAKHGIAGLTKVLLQLRHRRLVPSLHADPPNPHIPWSELPIAVPTTARPWPDGRRLAGVSSFGFSGTNAHVILEAVVPASASPHIVPAPWSDPSVVDPEEAFVASVSSCHMLFFLDFARHSGVAVTAYEDEVEGVMHRGDDGVLRAFDLPIALGRITRVTLRPQVGFGGEAPDAAAIEALHHKAHKACFIANSIRAEVVVEPR